MWFRKATTNRRCVQERTSLRNVKAPVLVEVQCLHESGQVVIQVREYFACLLLKVFDNVVFISLDLIAGDVEPKETPREFNYALGLRATYRTQVPPHDSSIGWRLLVTADFHWLTGAQYSQDPLVMLILTLRELVGARLENCLLSFHRVLNQRSSY